MHHPLLKKKLKNKNSWKNMKQNAIYHLLKRAMDSGVGSPFFPLLYLGFNVMILCAIQEKAPARCWHCPFVSGERRRAGCLGPGNKRHNGLSQRHLGVTDPSVRQEAGKQVPVHNDQSWVRSHSHLPSLSASCLSKGPRVIDGPIRSAPRPRRGPRAAPCRSPGVRAAHCCRGAQ